MLLPLKKATKRTWKLYKLILLQMIFQWKLCKLHYTCYEAHTLKCFQIVTHSCTASFSIKTHFYETNNIFSLTDLRKNIKNFWKCIHNESIFSFDTFRTFAYVSCNLQDHCKKTRLCNIFKIINQDINEGSILECPNKLLQRSLWIPTLNQPIQVSLVVQFLATFHV